MDRLSRAVSNWFTPRSSTPTEEPIQDEYVTTYQYDENIQKRGNEEELPLCSVCETLSFHQILKHGIPKENAVPLGPLTVILAKAGQCSFCRLVSGVFNRAWLLDKNRDVDLSEVGCALYCVDCGCLQHPTPTVQTLSHRLYIQPSTRPHPIYNAILAAQTSLLLEIQLLEEDADKLGRGKKLHGRRIGDMVDIKLVKKWLDLCEEDHTEGCASVWWKNNEGLPINVRLIDVDTMAIVCAPPASRYVALSYLWGGAGPEYWTNRANLKQRCIRGGLDIACLPATIADSIEVVRAVGERYLWVDALCIIQDDPQDKAVQIHIMDLIYGMSTFTIFAAGGETAYAPLPGVRAGTRTNHQHIETIRGLHLALPLPDLREALGQCTWNTRGWTYQEVMLSRRRIFFTKEQTYFECGLQIWSEDLNAESKYNPRAYQPLDNKGAGTFIYRRAPAPWLKKEYVMGYMSAIASYSQRRLTFESDIINGVTAITNAIARGFNLYEGDPNKAFRFGMSIPDLDQALLWQPELGTLQSRRLFPNIFIPSWSWAGWLGAVRFASIQQFRDTTSDTNVPLLAGSLVARWYIVEEDTRISSLQVNRIKRFEAYPEGQSICQLCETPRNYTEFRSLDFINRDAQKLRPGTLIFEGSSNRLTVTACVVTSTAQNNSDDSTRIFDILLGVPGNTSIGRIILPATVLSPTVLEFIALSRTEGEGYYDEDKILKKYCGCLLYVMAVKEHPNEKSVERIGVGVVFEGAWLESQPQEKLVFLE